MKKGKMELTILSDYVMKHHMKSIENWREGSIKEVWEESDSICVRYESGNWWHYKIDGSNVVWW